ncbi:hypothetical protein ACFOWZ_41760 [Lentzea rhizosphaerae]|uniref:NERD domain-containing protein n=1 Tax=Lentzea rhizosphaerae TaxID=2041025 RepID=A0ABV8C849_9PSEU
MTVLTSMRRALPGPANFGSDAVLEFYGGLVTGMPVDDVLSRLGADYHPQVLYDLDRLLREYAIAENRVHEAKALRVGPRDSLTSARNLLEFEQRFDRMLGYPEQLRPIFKAIVEPLADKSRTSLGFALGDALTVADVYFDVQCERLRRVQQEFQVVLDQIPPRADHATVVQYAAAHAAGMATFGAAPLEDDLASLLAQRTSIPRDQLEALLGSLSTALGSQPELDSLHAANTLRRRPIVTVPGGRHLWAVPGDFIHCALDWAAEACQQGPQLLEAFDKRRQDTCEELTCEVLSQVFGADNVHASVTYPWDGQRPDIDVLVALPGATVIVEAKGGRLTDPARRGAPDRIRKKAAELVDKALDQNARTIEYLRSGASNFQQNRKKWHGTINRTHIVSVIVTLERVDPFASVLPDSGKRAGVPDEGTWFVNLADVLMIADILRHPAEFHAYAATRARINKAGGPRIFVEADALGAWCEHRIAPTTPRPGELILLDTTSSLMNDYYAYSANNRPERPTAGVPGEVLRALDEIQLADPDSWHDLASAALAVPPSRWRPVEKAINQMSGHRVSRRGRKLSRRASSGLAVSDRLIVTVQADDLDPPAPRVHLALDQG